MADRKSKLTYRADERVPDPDPFSGRPPIDSIEIGHRTFVTATVQPLDVTGLRTVAVGGATWFVALVILIPLYPTLKEQGHGWWLWTCAAGFVLGLLGFEYCRRRLRRLASRPAHEVETSPLGAAGL